MAKVSIADKQTLDETKALALTIDDKCDKILESGGSSKFDLKNVRVFVLDYIMDDVTFYAGAADGHKRIATT